jgi:hypothetical protein
MLRLTNQVVRKEDREKPQRRGLEKVPNQDAQRNVGGSFGKSIFFTPFYISPINHPLYI